MIRFHVESRFYANRFAIFMQDEQGERRALAKPIVFEKVEPEKEGLLSTDPALDLQASEAQELFEAMWRAGFRSKHDRGSVDTLDAARLAHIEDLRRAAFETVTVNVRDRTS
jgi:hypothetical protein